MYNRLFLLAAFALIVSCRTTISKPESAPGVITPGVLGLSTIDVSYKYLADPRHQSGFLDPNFGPWTDSYWPKSNGGIAHRWVYDERYVGEKLSWQLGSLLEIVGRADPKEIATLSPAEKIDLVNMGAKIREFAVNPTLQADLKFLGELEREDGTSVQERRSRYARVVGALNAPRLLQTIKRLFPVTIDAFGQLARTASDKSTNISTLFKDRSRNDAEFSNLAKLRSFYWEGICHGWASAAIREKRPLHSVVLQTHGVSIPFFQGDIRGLLSFAWANQGTEYQDNPETRFVVGQRCESHGTKLRFDRQTLRQLDGIVCPATSAAECKNEIMSAGGEQRVNYGQWRVFAYPFGEKIYTVAEYDEYLGLDAKKESNLLSLTTEKKYALIHDPTTRKPVEFGKALSYQLAPGGIEYYGMPFEKLDALELHLSSKLDRTILNVYFHHDCKSMNPALLHVVLVQMLAIKKLGVIVDKDIAGEVWNQPVAGFKVKNWGPLRELKKETYKSTMAPGTKFLADVQTEVTWIEEPRLFKPLVTYFESDGPKNSFDHDLNKEVRKVSTLSYTLEFDRERRLIGGEWGRDILNTAIERVIVNFGVDYLWGFAADSAYLKEEGQLNFRGGDGIFSIRQLRKIHECSRDTTKKLSTYHFVRNPPDNLGESESATGPTEESFRAVECSLSN